MDINKVPWKKLAIGVLICAVVTGGIASGAAWYHHQQEQAAHEQRIQARTTMIQAQADQRSLALLDTNAIRSLTAQAIGQDETSITFREITLINAADPSEKNGKKDKKEKKEHRERITPVDLPEATAAEPHTQFQPVYTVSCRVAPVKYKLQIDAITGTVLKSTVKDLNED